VVKPEWVGDAGLASFDPTQVVGYALYADEEEAGTIWVDDVTLVAGGEAPPVVAPEPTDDTVLPTEELGEDDQRGPICGMMALPLGCLGVFWVLRRRRR
jgi:MYXO-CTERM domain-containing protein